MQSVIEVWEWSGPFGVRPLLYSLYVVHRLRLLYFSYGISNYGRATERIKKDIPDRKNNTEAFRTWSKKELAEFVRCTVDQEKYEQILAREGAL